MTMVINLDDDFLRTIAKLQSECLRENRRISRCVLSHALVERLNRYLDLGHVPEDFPLHRIAAIASIPHKIEMDAGQVGTLFGLIPVYVESGEAPEDQRLGLDEVLVYIASRS